MKIDAEILQRRMESFRAGLKKAGIKITQQRLEIFREAAKTDAHPDAETIFRGVRKRLPTVSLDTVYRTLWMLNDLGLLKALGLPHERVKFDANLMNHHHFYCLSCGMTRDFDAEALAPEKIAAAVQTWGSVTKTQLEASGLCWSCSQKIELYNHKNRGKEEKS